ncbi:MAG: hypothetical protein GX442_23785 [Candidatus Riflebacteria bacterium]|nr:hypothetical protein [Candidatus Riflebacteria bacterium]
MFDWVRRLLGMPGPTRKEPGADDLAVEVRARFERLVTGLKSPDTGLRESAIPGLLTLEGLSPDRLAGRLDSLLDLVGTPEDTLPGEAVPDVLRLLAGLGRSGAAVLVRNLDPSFDADTVVRIQEALFRCGSPAIPAMIAGLAMAPAARGMQPSFRREHLVPVLADLGDAAVPALVEARRHRDPDIRRGILEVLRDMGGEGRQALSLLRAEVAEAAAPDEHLLAALAEVDPADPGRRRAQELLWIWKRGNADDLPARRDELTALVATHGDPLRQRVSQILRPFRTDLPTAVRVAAVDVLAGVGRGSDGGRDDLGRKDGRSRTTGTDRAEGTAESAGADRAEDAPASAGNDGTTATAGATGAARAGRPPPSAGAAGAPFLIEALGWLHPPALLNHLRETLRRLGPAALPALHACIRRDQSARDNPGKRRYEEARRLVSHLG